MNTHIGRIIRAARRASGLTLEEVAEQVGVTAGALSHIESGRRLPSPSNAVAIAAAVGLSAEEVLVALDEEHSSRRRSSLRAHKPAGLLPSESEAREPEIQYYKPLDIELLFQPSASAPSAPASASMAPPPMQFPDTGSMRDAARWSEDTDVRLDALSRLADSASDAIRTLRGLVDDEDPTISREARRLLRELDVRTPEE